MSQGQKAVHLTSSLVLVLNAKLLGEKVNLECERVILKEFNKMKCRLYGNEKLLFQRYRSYHHAHLFHFVKREWEVV